MLALLLVPSSQHEPHSRRREKELSRQEWLRSSGAFRADGKGLMRRHEAQAMEAWWCSQAGNEGSYSCRARAFRELVRNTTNATLRREMAKQLLHRPTDAIRRKVLVNQARTMRDSYCAEHSGSFCDGTGGTLGFLARRVARLGQDLHNSTRSLRRTLRRYGRAVFAGEAGPNAAFLDNTNYTRGRRRRQWLRMAEERPRTAWMD